ncbi:very-long-chain enoyl-CoA reductase-like [Crotalus adamanteus]|uniref:Very-long-chain enoyl-CoA reductase n=1 Tax=Crotalus adamanteus TaxID=8729 RepID=A0AAW1BQD0_CROAD
MLLCCPTAYVRSELGQGEPFTASRKLRSAAENRTRLAAPWHNGSRRPRGAAAVLLRIPAPFSSEATTELGAFGLQAAAAAAAAAAKRKERGGNGDKGSETAERAHSSLQGYLPGIGSRRAGNQIPGEMGSRITFFEVEILDWKTKQQLCFLEKVEPHTTISDIQAMLHKIYPQWYPARQSIRLDPKGKSLKNEEILQLLPFGTTATLYFKDLGPQIGWTMVRL